MAGLIAGLGACTETEPEAPAYVAPARAGDVVVARVEGTPIYLSDVQLLAVGQGRVTEAKTFEPTREDFAEVRDQLVDARVLALAARDEGLQNDREAVRRRAIFEERMLGNLLVESRVDETITEDALLDLYYQQLELREPVPQVRGRQLIAPTREAAQAARARIEDGEDFDDVAADASLVAGTEREDLGWFTRDSLERDLTDAAFATEPGNLSAPVESDAGWHVIQVEEVREDAPPTFEALRDELEAFLVNDLIVSLMAEARAGTEIELLQPVGTVPGLRRSGTDRAEAESASESASESLPESSPESFQVGDEDTDG